MLAGAVVLAFSIPMTVTVLMLVIPPVSFYIDPPISFHVIRPACVHIDVYPGRSREVTTDLDIYIKRRSGYCSRRSNGGKSDNRCRRQCGEDRNFIHLVSFPSVD